MVYCWPYRGHREQVRGQRERTRRPALLGAARAGEPRPYLSRPKLSLSIYLSQSSQIQGGGALIRVCSCFGLRSVRLLVYADEDANCALDGMPELLPDQDPAEIRTR